MAALGGTHLELHSPFTFFGSAQAQFRGAELDATTAQTVENLAPVVAEAAAPKCVLVWENIFDLHTDPLDGLVATFESPWVRRSIDTGHAHLMTARRAGRDPGAPTTDFGDNAGAAGPVAGVAS